MRRRGVMALLGLAPAAGASLGFQSVPTPANPSLAGWGAAVAQGFPDSPDKLTSEPDPDYSLKRAQAQARLLRWRREHGFRSVPRMYEQCHCIESRRATSPAIKAILNRERQDRLELEEAEEGVRFQIVKRMAPDWVRRILDY